MKQWEEYKPVTPEEIFQAAYVRRPIYNLPPPEDALYCRASMLYDRFRHEELTPEEGETERQLAMAIYMRAKNSEQQDRKTLEASGALFRRVEQAAADYRAAPGPETAAAVLEAIYKVPFPVLPWEEESKEEAKG